MISVQDIINATLANKNNLSYINIKNNKYLGWTSNFNIKFDTNEEMKLDLTKEKDLFLLFVLASAWSKTGPFENAAYFVSYLKYFKLDDPNLWKNKGFVINEELNRKESVNKILNVCIKKLPKRREIYFREDFYSSITVIANNWDEIKRQLHYSNDNNNFMHFIEYLNNIEGLGAGNNKMNIKILLILRELRCQNIFNGNIPGELCCVPDARVKTVFSKLYRSGIVSQDLPKNYKKFIESSKIIYSYFGDLYDIPLFAYEDFYNDNELQRLGKNRLR